MSQRNQEHRYPGEVFCQYAEGKCPETFPLGEREKVLLLYPSKPSIISSTIESAAEAIAKKHAGKSYLTWKHLRKEGKVIFCEICKAIMSSSYVVCDITTLNFNLLFEIGYIVGLSKKFLPVFDTSYGSHKNLLTKIGLLDTVGYREFTNSQNLVEIIEAGAPDVTCQRSSENDSFRPIYYVKTPVDTEGSLRITSSLKKSWFRFRVHDPAERPRLPLTLAIREVDKSRAVVVHLLSPERRDAVVHNARCAFVAGAAMAAQKLVLLIQEGKAEHPIDYRDLIREYERPTQLNLILDDFFRKLVDTLQSPVKSVASVRRSALEDIDIGDIAAENEIENLRSYFVRTGEFTAARKGHAQIVVGRKGSGKTALFYALRHHIGPERMNAVVLDLKPEGYQFAKLHETIFQKFTPAVRQHTLTAIWDYVLSLEIAHKVLDDKKEATAAHRNPETEAKWYAIKQEYAHHRSLEEGDFSERLNSLVGSIIHRVPKTKTSLSAPEVTQIVYLHDIKKLRLLLVDYLSDREEVWLLFDNLDKNWRVHRQDDYEAVILRCLLDATRKLQKILLKQGVNFHAVIFIRNDIYSFFLDKTTDRGKEQVAHLNWDDTDTFKEILRLRVARNRKFDVSFEDMWSTIFDLHVAGESSFNYVIRKTLMRPRDFLLFVHFALQTAINRGHNRVSADDILQAEEAYSRDLFEGLVYEIRDVDATLENILYCFVESKRTLRYSDLAQILREGNVPTGRIDEVIRTLLWFCFLGVCASDMSERYANGVGYDIKKLLRLTDWATKDESEPIYAIHPGFTTVLELTDNDA